MRTILALLLFTLPLLGAKPEEISSESGQRKVLFDLVRPEVAKQAKLRTNQVKFEGSLKKLGNWAFFGGRSLDSNSKSLKLEPLGNDDTCALFLKTRKGWVLVDWSAGHSDVVYYEWITSYHVPSAVLGLSDD